LSKLGRRLLIGLILGVLVAVGMGMYADAAKLGQSLSAFTWGLLAPVLGLTLLNYVLRFLKWHYNLRVLDAEVPVGDSALVFLAGFSMAVTPGKFGELLKALLLKDRSGVPATATASVVVAERLTDFLALIFLAAGGVVGSRHGVEVLAVSVLGSVIFLACIASERISMGVIALIGRVPIGARIAPKLEEMYRAMARLVRPVPLIGTTILSIAAWSCECVGFYLVLTGIAGATPNLGDATFIYAFATIFGAVTMLPGGLGATEGSLIGLSLAFGLAATRAAATAAAMIIRFCTLWFAVLVGLVALSVLRLTSDAPIRTEDLDVASDAH